MIIQGPLFERQFRIWNPCLDCKGNVGSRSTRNEDPLFRRTFGGPFKALLETPPVGPSRRAPRPTPIPRTSSLGTGSDSPGDSASWRRRRFLSVHSLLACWLACLLAGLHCCAPMLFSIKRYRGGNYESWRDGAGFAVNGQTEIFGRTSHSLNRSNRLAQGLSSTQHDTFSFVGKGKYDPSIRRTYRY